MMFHNFGFNQPIGPYNKQFRCYPVVMMAGKERRDVDKGGKIILPPSALDHLTQLHIQFPMLFKLTNKGKNRETHCGVLEFVAEEGRCYLPYWMMRNLLLSEGDMIQVEYVNLEIGKFVKLQPQSVDFLEISNPKAVLENALRNFATLTKGDVISINYNEKDYELCILETRPRNAISIIECDMDVDFAAPVGYQEPQREIKPSACVSHFEKLPDKTPTNEGYRLDGKVRKNKTSESEGSRTTSQSQDNLPKGVPFYDYQPGNLRFNRDFSTDKIQKTTKEENVAKGGHKLKNIGVNKL